VAPIRIQRNTPQHNALSNQQAASNGSAAGLGGSAPNADQHGAAIVEVTAKVTDVVTHRPFLIHCSSIKRQLLIAQGGMGRAPLRSAAVAI
jgi:hypothetical protein